MTGLAGLRVVVAGAGALGSAIAWRLQADGARVVRLDGAASDRSASGVAAGMLAPAFETLLDEMSVGRYGLLQAARNEWPDFVDGLRPFGGGVERSGALWVGGDESQEDILRQLTAVGAEAQRLSPAQAGRASPGLKAPAGAIQTPEDWRLDPQALLPALRDAFLAEGCGPPDCNRSTTGPSGCRTGRGSRADAVVLGHRLGARGYEPTAAGTGMAAADQGPDRPSPRSGPRDGPVIRASGLYVTPGARGPAIGATMEVGPRGPPDRRRGPRSPDGAGEAAVPGAGRRGGRVGGGGARLDPGRFADGGVKPRPGRGGAGGGRAPQRLGCWPR